MGNKRPRLFTSADQLIPHDPLLSFDLLWPSCMPLPFILLSFPLHLLARNRKNLYECYGYPCCRMVFTPSFFQKIFKNFRIVKYCIHIWHKHGKCIKMNTNKPMFGPVVLEIACDIFINKTSCFHWTML